MSVWRTYRGLFRNGPLTRLLIGEFVSSIGDWLFLVAFVVIVYERTQDPILLGIVGAARILPYVVLSIPAGMLSDRFDRRMVLLVTDIGRAACMLVLAWLVTNEAPLWAIAAVAIVSTCQAVFFYPAMGALLPSLVRDESEFGPANSAWATLDNLAWVVGPAIGGVLLATGDVGTALLLNAVSFTLIAVVLWRLPRPGAVAARVVGRRGTRAGQRPCRGRPDRLRARHPALDRPARHRRGAPDRRDGVVRVRRGRRS